MAAKTTVVFLMFFAALAVQSTYSVSDGGIDGVCSRRMESLVGHTQASIKKIPYAWAPEYEVAVVYMTSKWSEIDIPNKAAQMAVAKTAFLSFCVNQKNILNNLMVQVNAIENESQEVKNDVLAWFNYAVGKYVGNDDSLPKEGDVDFVPEFWITKFQKANTHFINRSKVTYDKTNLDETKRAIDDVSKEMMDMLLETIKNLTQQYSQLQNNQRSNSLL